MFKKLSICHVEFISVSERLMNTEINSAMKLSEPFHTVSEFGKEGIFAIFERFSQKSSPLIPFQRGKLF